MKLFWHIGPHKTGTTSMQLGLGSYANTRRASFYYPPTGDHGPGHADLAWGLLGLNGRPKSSESMYAEIDRAYELGFSKIVISSEEFSRALLVDSGFETMARICSDVETELIVTLRPLTERIYPEVQERIKHGIASDITSTEELLKICAASPGLRADFLPAAFERMNASAISVVSVDSTRPQKLFDDLSTIIGEPIPTPRKVRANVSTPVIMALWLNALNTQMKGQDPNTAELGPLGAAQRRLRAVSEAFDVAGKQMPFVRDMSYPPLPKPIREYLDGVWSIELAYLSALEAAGRLRRL
jgi:hypothetical protein